MNSRLSRWAEGRRDLEEKAVWLAGEVLLYTQQGIVDERVQINRPISARNQRLRDVDPRSCQMARSGRDKFDAEKVQKSQKNTESNKTVSYFPSTVFQTFNVVRSL